MSKRNPGVPATSTKPALTVVSGFEAQLDPEAVVAFLSESEQFMVADLARSDLTPGDIDVEPLPRKVPAYAIKHHLSKADVIREDSAQRYDCPEGFADIWVRSPESYRVWREAQHKFVVEGAKKSAWLVKNLQVPAVGIAGCWNWSNDHELLPQIRDGLRSGDLVTVILDGDIATKPDVAKAAGSLAAQLKAQGCVAEFIQLPQGPNGEKIGLDDWGVAQPKRKPPVWRALLDGLPRIDIAKLPVNAASLTTLLPDLIAQTTRNGSVVIVPNETNSVTLLRHWFGDKLRTDIYVGPRFGGQVFREGEHDIEMLARFQHEADPRWQLRHVVEARRAVLAQNRCNELAAWLSGLVWDGVPRIATMWQRYCFSEQPADYLAGVARALMYAAVTRAMVDTDADRVTTGDDAQREQFRTKYDNMVVLESSVQGKSKTMFWQVLAGVHPSGHEYCVEAPHSHKLDDFNRAGSNAWFLTLDELAQFKPKEVKDLKSWLSAIFDTWVPKYKELAQTRLRRFVVVGTTNEEEYLVDPTGNRRHHPISCGATIDIAALQRDREQLWAEAVALYRQKLDKWWVVPGAEEEQEGRATELQYEQEITTGIAHFGALPTARIETKRGKTKRVEFISKTMVHAWIGGSENRDHNKLIRAGQAMRKLGWIKGNQTRFRKGAIVVGDLPHNACGDPGSARSGRVWPGAIPDRDQYYVRLKDISDE